MSRSSDLLQRLEEFVVRPEVEGHAQVMLQSTRNNPLYNMASYAHLATQHYLHSHTPSPNMAWRAGIRPGGIPVVPYHPHQQVVDTVKTAVKHFSDRWHGNDIESIRNKVGME